MSLLQQIGHQMTAKRIAGTDANYLQNQVRAGACFLSPALRALIYYLPRVKQVGADEPSEKQGWPHERFCGRRSCRACRWNNRGVGCDSARLASDAGESEAQEAAPESASSVAPRRQTVGAPSLRSGEGSCFAPFL